MGSLRVLVRTQSFLVMKPIRTKIAPRPCVWFPAEVARTAKFGLGWPRSQGPCGQWWGRGSRLLCQDLMGKDQDDADDYERSEHGLAVCHEV